MANARPLIAPASEWQSQLVALSGGGITHRGAGRLYLRFLSSLLSGLVLACDMVAPLPQAQRCIMQMRGGTASPLSKPMRTSTSMAGLGRMNNLVKLLERIASQKPPVSGAYLEAGVWRGGMSILATAAMQQFGLEDRKVYLCDSFAGLPMPRKGSLGPGETFYALRMNGTLAVGEMAVLANFDRFSVPRTQVSTVPGYFVHSLGPLRDRLLRSGEKLALLRLDGDIYDSTADILYNLYDLLSVGGYLIVDDFGWRDGVRQQALKKGLGNSTTLRATFGAKNALLDFRHLHGLEDGQHVMVDIDGTGAYFRKGRDVPLQRERYLSALRTGNYLPLRPPKPITMQAFATLMEGWERHSPASTEETKRIHSLRRSFHMSSFDPVCKELCQPSSSASRGVAANTNEE